MSIDDILARATARESTIWGDSFNGPFDSVHSEERTLIFGLYASAYLNGQDYLSDISAEDLAKLVDVYTTNMARLSNAEAQAVLEIAAKRYLNNIEGQIHESKKATRRAQLDALNDEYDAKTSALDADYAALETMRKTVEAEKERLQLTIKEIENKIELESFDREMVDVERSSRTN